MFLFACGLVAGWASALLASLFISRYTRRRIVTLQNRARQAERLAELGALTGGLAHEIKNPLSTVQLNLQLLQEDLAHDNPAFARLNNRLNIAQRETSRLREILDDFLRYGGKMELDRREVDLDSLLADMVDFFSPQAQVHRVQLRLRPVAAPLRAVLDEKLVKQAVLNLMLNAMQAMPAGGEMILFAAPGENEAVIHVVDTGSGIAPEAVSQIFDAYYSTRRGGTGLGLAMTRRIAQEHGGRVNVSSEVGKGSDFSLHLPTAAAAPQA